MNVKDELIDRLIDLAFAEDIGDGDHTTLSTIPADAMGKNMLLIKEDGVLAGVEMAKRIFARFDEALQVEVLIEDGAEVLNLMFTVLMMAYLACRLSFTYYNYT